MALPPIDTDTDLEAEDEEMPLEDEGLEGELPAEMPDPMFAADVAEAFPDLDDAQLLALQRAVLGLISSGGGGAAPPAMPAPMGF